MGGIQDREKNVDKDGESKRRFMKGQIEQTDKTRKKKGDEFS